MSRPIRKRAFYRALKAGKLWAIVPYELMAGDGPGLTIGPNHFAKVQPDKNCPSNVAYVMWPLDNMYEHLLPH